MKELTMAVSLSRGSDGTWRMDVEDRLSGLRVIQLRFSDEAFARVLSTQFIDVQGVLYDSSERWGMERVVGSVVVNRDKLGASLDEYMAEHHPEWEHWRESDLTNMHCRTGEPGNYRVSVCRWEAVQGGDGAGGA